MKTSLTTIIVTVLLSLTVALAEEPVATKQTLTLEGAKKAGDAAAAYARQNGASGAIAVVDDGGHLLYFLRLENAFAASSSVSIGKAKTAALFKKPTKDFEEIINKGRIAMTTLPPDFTPLQGGVPIKYGDQIVGAIGVSGAKSAAQDEEVAKAGAAAVEETRTASK
jgi:glc operon protein GlcG